MQKTLSTIKSIIIVLTLTIGMSYVFAVGTWTNPPAGTVPPDNNTDAPINVGSAAQSKDAGLSLNGDLLSLADVCVVHMDGNTVVPDKCLRNLTGGGVSKIIAGNGITVTSTGTGGTGNVTVTATGSATLQYQDFVDPKHATTGYSQFTASTETPLCADDGNSTSTFSLESVTVQKFCEEKGFTFGVTTYKQPPHDALQNTYGVNFNGNPVSPVWGNCTLNATTSKTISKIRCMK